MATAVSEGRGAFRRLMIKLARWSEAMDYSSFDYTVDRIAVIERELAGLKDRMRRLEASRHEPSDMPDAVGTRSSPGTSPEAA